MNEPKVGGWGRSVCPWKRKGKWHCIGAITQWAAEAACGQAALSKTEYTETSEGFPVKGRVCKRCAQAKAKREALG